MARVDKAMDEKRDDIISLALSDKASFDAIEHQFGLSEDQVKLLMKKWLKGGSYRAWRRRVENFRQQRQVYKASNDRGMLQDNRRF